MPSMVRLAQETLVQEVSKALELAQRAAVQQRASLRDGGMYCEEVAIDPVVDTLTCIKAFALDADAATPVVLEEEDYNLIMAVNLLIGKGYV